MELGAVSLLAPACMATMSSASRMVVWDKGKAVASGADVTFRLGPKLYTVNIDFRSNVCSKKEQIFAGIIASYNVDNNHSLILILNS